MKSTAKLKVVTSGRLTGGRVQLNRRQVTPHPGPGSCPDPAYSLYSTDSEDQVTTLHQGLDRCAALLSGILQAEAGSAPPSFPRPGTSGASRSRSTTSVGKKTMKKAQRKSVHKNPQPGPGSTTPRPGPRSPAAHSGVKLHPPRRPLYGLRQDHQPPSRSQTSIPPSQSQTSIPPSKSQTVLLSVVQSSTPSDQLPVRQPDSLSAPEAPPTRSASECDGEEEEEEEEESVPVRDVDTKSSATHKHPSTREESDTHLNPQTRTRCRPESVQYLLGELRALISGQGSVAERLLSRLEQTMSSPLINVGTETDPDLNQNLQLQRLVMTLTQQLKEKEKHQKNMETLSHSQVTALQQQLSAAQSRLQEVQMDLAELREALQDTQSRLRGREAETTTIRTELEAVRNRLVESEREKSELASLAQKRLEEIENLNRILLDSSETPTLVDNSDLQQHRPVQTPPERITQYLVSLDQLGPTHTELMAAEKESSALEPQTQTSVQMGDTGSHKPAETSHLDQNGLDPVQLSGRQLEKGSGRLWNSTLSQCEVESNWSDWSMRSGSTFDTRDEAAFRDGLAALDASIASLQKTIQLDLRR